MLSREQGEKSALLEAVPSTALANITYRFPAKMKSNGTREREVEREVERERGRERSREEKRAAESTAMWRPNN